MIEWQQVSAYDRVPEPVKGFDLKYDTSKKAGEVVEKELQSYLSEVRELLGNRRNYNINLVQSKYLYEIEVPKELVEGQRPADFELTS